MRRARATSSTAVASVLRELTFIAVCVEQCVLEGARLPGGGSPRLRVKRPGRGERGPARQAKEMGGGRSVI